MTIDPKDYRVQPDKKRSTPAKWPTVVAPAMCRKKQYKEILQEHMEKAGAFAATASLRVSQVCSVA